MSEKAEKYVTIHYWSGHILEREDTCAVWIKPPKTA